MFLHRLIVLLVEIVVVFCDISCDSGYIRAKTYRWKSNVTECIHPISEQQIVDIILEANDQRENDRETTIRAIGASVSYTAVGMIDDDPSLQNVIILNTTTNMNNITNIDLENNTITVQSGVRLGRVIQALESIGASLYYSGGTRISNIVGWFMSGTHGGGSPQRNPIKAMANNVVGLRMVIGNGTVLDLKESDDIFYAALISFGSLGIITEVTIKFQPELIYTQHSNQYWQNQTDINVINNTFYNDIIPVFDNYDSLECFYRWFDENWHCNFWVYVDTHDQQSAQNNISSQIYYESLMEKSHTIDNFQYAGNRRFQIQYNVMYELWPEAEMSVIEYVHHQKLQKTYLWNETYRYAHDENAIDSDFFVSFRLIQGDDIWLSPSGFGNNTIMVQINTVLYEECPEWIVNEWSMAIYKLLRDNFSPIRVHWGKLSLSDYCTLKDSYPKLDEFKQLREELDPYDLFLNKFTTDKLGLCDDKCCCTNYSCITSEQEEVNVVDAELVIIIIATLILILILFVGLVYYCFKRQKSSDNNQRELSTLLT